MSPTTGKPNQVTDIKPGDRITLIDDNQAIVVTTAQPPAANGSVYIAGDHINSQGKPYAQRTCRGLVLSGPAGGTWDWWADRKPAKPDYSGHLHRLVSARGDGVTGAYRRAHKQACGATVYVSPTPGCRAEFGDPSVSVRVDEHGNWTVSVTAERNGVPQDVASGTIRDTSGYAWMWPTHQLDLPGLGDRECVYSGLVLDDPAIWAPDGNRLCPTGCKGSEAIWGAPTDPETRARVIRFDRIVELLKPHGVYGYVEQTGGGCSTIYIGDEPPEGQPLAVMLMAGPGWFEGNGQAYGSTGEFSVGPDEDDYNTFTPKGIEIPTWAAELGDTEDTIAAQLVEMYRQIQQQIQEGSGL